MNYAKYIDHTLLKANATKNDVIKLCEEAKKYNFMSVCVNPCFIEIAKEVLLGTDILICTVIGFPLGADTILTKENATIDAIKLGANEIDMVINIGKAKEKDFEYLHNEIRTVVDAARGNTVKVIFETCYLNEEEKILVCNAATLAGALFVKTSTGFGTSGATIEDVKLMRDNINSEMSVKASGGIRNSSDFLSFIKAGANRIGTSNGVAIIEELKKGV
ncbi:MAG: deoxyribose-phosphate aldolase [Bacilli bacterium]|nr:deoxyribose-phosphate aldolase [Bacilli bacterium]